MRKGLLILAAALGSGLVLVHCGDGSGGGAIDPDTDGTSQVSAVVGPDGCPRIVGTIACAGGPPIRLAWRSENDRNVYRWGANDFVADGVPRPHLTSRVTTTCKDAAVDFRTDTDNPPATLSAACGGAPYVGTYLWTTYKVVDGSLMSRGRSGLKCEDGSDFQSFDSGDLPCP